MGEKIPEVRWTPKTAQQVKVNLLKGNQQTKEDKGGQ